MKLDGYGKAIFVVTESLDGSPNQLNSVRTSVKFMEGGRGGRGKTLYF